MKVSRWMPAVLSGALLVSAIGISTLKGQVRPAADGKVGPTLTTPYQAVLLSNGQAYFGKMEGVGTAYPVLTDVYYIQTSVKAETKEPTNVLIKRGNEWHAPDRIILNAAHILFIEPVTPGSTLDKLIKEEKAKKTPEAQPRKAESR